jgi:hypothetical protein
MADLSDKVVESTVQVSARVTGGDSFPTSGGGIMAVTSEVATRWRWSESSCRRRGGRSSGRWHAAGPLQLQATEDDGSARFTSHRHSLRM